LVLSLLNKEQELEAALAARNAEADALSDELTGIHASYAAKIDAVVREMQATHEVRQGVP
jgi:hypothetical protein